MSIPPFLARLAILLFTLIGMVWLSAHFLGGLALGLSLWAIVVLQRTNLTQALRHTQWPWPLAALLWSAVALGLMLWLREHYQPYLAAHGSAIGWLQQRLGVQIPADFAQAVATLGAVFLCVFALAKGFVMPGIGADITAHPAHGGQTGLAYHQLPGLDWRLIPRWLYVRRLAQWAAVTALAIMIVSGLVIERLLDFEWLPLLAPALLLVGMELSAWLGGEVGDEWKPRLEGEDAIPDLHGQFLSLWKAYRDTWPGKWLVAGNLPPPRPGSPAVRQ